MLFFKILGYGLIGLGTVGTLLPLIPYDDWWIRGGDYPRVQFAVLLALGGATLLFAHRAEPYPNLVLAFLVVATLCLLFQLYRILPYTRIWTTEVLSAPLDSEEHADTLHLLISNVLQSNDEHGRLFDLVARETPDLLLTLETNAAWERDLLAALGDDYPNTVKVPLENRYGMHLFSKFPLRATKVQYLISDTIPSIYTEVQLESGAWIKLYCLHPTPPSPTEESASTARDAELGLTGMRIKDTGNSNTIVAGDLNDVAWSHSTRLFQRLSGLLDPRVGRGLFASFHADHWFARWPLDHVFHSDEFQVAQLRRLEHIGSDHFPMSVKLRYVPEEEHLQKQPKEDKGDRDEADTTIKKAKAGEVDGLLVD